MNVTLRQATTADRPFVKDVYFESQRGMIEGIYGLRGDVEENEWFDDFYSEECTQFILVEDHEVGFMSLLRDAGITNVQCLFLRAEHQSRGVGTRLLRAVIAQATRDGNRLTIGTEKVNPAKRLYERLGFVVIRETKYRIDFAYPMEGVTDS